MFDEIINVSTIDEFDAMSVMLLDNGSLRKLQEDMVNRDVSLSRADYWTVDILDRRTTDSAAVERALEIVAKEEPDKKILHLLQMVSVLAPGASEGVQRFLKRVTFA